MVEEAGHPSISAVHHGSGSIALLVPTVFEGLPLFGLRPTVIGIRAIRQNRIKPESTAFILAGFAGACAAALRCGDVLLGGQIPTGLAATRAVDGVLKTVDHILRPSEKLALGAQGIDAVDMESEIVASWASARDQPFLSIRVILDEAGAPAAGLRSARGYPMAARILRRTVGDALRLWPDRQSP